MERKSGSAHRQADGSSDRRWVVLVEDGRFSTLGRARDPSEDEIRRAEEALREQGLSGWLAVMSGSAYGETMPLFVEVRPLADPSTIFTDAVAACQAAIAAGREQAN